MFDGCRGRAHVVPFRSARSAASYSTTRLATARLGRWSFKGKQKNIETPSKRNIGHLKKSFPQGRETTYGDT